MLLNTYEEFDNLKNHFEKNNRVRDFPAHSQKILCLNWNVDGTRLASGSVDKTVCTFALSQDKLVKEYIFRGHNELVDQLSWSPKNLELLATSSSDKTIRVWDAKNYRSLQSIQTSGETISFSWTKDGQTIAVCNREDSLSLIDVRTWKIREKIKDFGFEVIDINFSNDNELFFVASGSGNIHIYDYPGLEKDFILTGSNTICYCIAFDPKGKHFAIGTADTVVSIFDLENFACKRTVARFGWPARTMSFSYDGELLATASEDNVIDISHVESGDRVYELRTEEFCYSTAFHPKRYLLAFACDDKDQRDVNHGVKLFGLKSD